MVRTRTLGLACMAAMLALGLALVANVALKPAKIAHAAGFQKVAYFEQWGFYQNPNGAVVNVDQSGEADQLTTMIYAFENIDPVNLTCFENIHSADTGPGGEQDANAGDGAADAFADYQKSFTTTVSGQPDTFNQPLKGNFNQLRELKMKHPNLRVVLSLGGWTYSKFFSDAAATPASRQKFASSCINMFLKGNLPTGIGGDQSGGAGVAAGIFDGFDIDWEFPGSNGGHLGNHTSPNDKQNFTALLQEFRSQLDAFGAQNGGKHYSLSAALPAGQEKIALIETNKIGGLLDFADVMTFDLHGSWEVNGPTNMMAQLHVPPGDPSAVIPPGHEKFGSDVAIQAWTQGLPDYNIPGGFPASKINLGIPFYWRGWTGVQTGSTHGLYQPATGPSPQQPFSLTPGTIFYKELESSGLLGNSANNFVDTASDSAWIYDGTNFYSGDTPQTIAVKTQFIRSQGLGGAFAWAIKDDGASNPLFNAIVSGLNGGGPPPTPTPSMTPTPTGTPTPTPTPSQTPSPTPSGTCAAPWSATQAYLGGSQAPFQAHNWTAKWWTQGDTPGGSIGVWTDNGPCSGGGAPPPTPAPGSCPQAWSASQAYVGGSVVSFNGHQWTAKWWTQGDTPGGSVGVWTDNGTCN